MNRTKYTDAELIQAARSCANRLEFIRKYRTLYEAARHRGLLAEIFSWLPKSDQRITEEEILAAVRTCSTRTEWQKKFRGQQRAAVRLGLLPKIHELLPAVRGGPQIAYTEEELIEDAKKYATRQEWQKAGEVVRKEGKVSPYNCALRFGREFLARCTGHMELRHRWTDDELVEVGLLYQHKGDWKRSTDARHSAAYQAALARPEVFARATAHMTPKANPYSGDYVVYAYEFQDRHAYVGLTFLPGHRKTQHTIRGPVAEHQRKCGQPPVYKEMATGLTDPASASSVEKEWIAKYRDAGWTLLNVSRGGGLGTIEREWTKELIMVEALKFPTKQAWIDGSQSSYRIAKREGWFEEACQHMPERDGSSLLGREVSDETKAKMAAAKKGTVQSPATRAKRAESAKLAWQKRKAR